MKFAIAVTVALAATIFLLSGEQFKVAAAPGIIEALQGGVLSTASGAGGILGPVVGASQAGAGTLLSNGASTGTAAKTAVTNTAGSVKSTVQQTAGGLGSTGTAVSGNFNGLLEAGSGLLGSLPGAATGGQAIVSQAVDAGQTEVGSDTQTLVGNVGSVNSVLNGLLSPLGQ